MTDPDAIKAADLKRRGAKWMERIRAAETREQTWLKDAKVAEDIYLANEKGDRQYDFNILHSNVETIVPATFNSSPIPDVRERFRKGAEDEPARIASQVIERCIQVVADDGKLDVEMEGVAQDSFMVGRGLMRVNMTMENGAEGIGFEVWPWNDFRFGKARRWKDVPWVAFRSRIPQDEVEKISDPKLREILKKGEQSPDDVPDDDSDAELWQVWDKDKRAVLMIVNDAVVREEPDPLGLSGFFPMPMPAMPIRSTSTLTPVVPFKIYERLADELDRITRRIDKLTEACRAVGLIAGEKADMLARLEDAEDGTLVPVGAIEGVASTQGMNEAIAWWPVENVVIALRELYSARDQCKQAIYEITGISDIVRGASQAQETATAQEIKTQWGSLRVKKLQKLIERLARDTFVICAEIICSKFQPATLQRMSGVQITPEVAALFGRPLDHFRIDVETDSTVRADLTRMRADMAEWLRGTSEFMNALIMPMVASPQTMALVPPAMKLYGTFARTFSLGKQGEDAIEEMIVACEQLAAQSAQQGPQQDPKAMEAQAKAQAAQAEGERKAAEMQMKQQLEAQKMQLEGQRLQIEGMNAERTGMLEAQETAAKTGLLKAQTELTYAKVGETQQKTEIADTAADIDAALAVQGDRRADDQSRFDQEMAASGEHRAAQGEDFGRSMQEREFERSSETQASADGRAKAESAAKVAAMKRKPNAS